MAISAIDSPESSGASRSKIVVGVDDESSNLALLEGMATAAGYRFFGTQSGRARLALVRQLTPRLILLDIQMPGMDGVETCRQLRTIPHLSQVPIAFLTARKTTEDVRTGMAAGGNDFIVKPFDPEKLVNRLRYWVARTVRPPP